MLISHEIAVLRQQGRLDEAYKAVRELLAADSTNLETLRQLGSIICDQLKALATTSPDDFIAKLKELKECHIPDAETFVYDALLWNLRAFVADEQKAENSLNQYLTSIFAIISDMPIRRQCLPFSVFVNTVLHRAKTWNGVGQFAYWCGLDYLRLEDFEPFITAEGKKLMSLAEQLDCKIGKYLLATHDKQKILNFLPMQEQFTIQHPKYTYPPYYLAKMYVEVGEYAKAQSTLIPFVRRKSQDFWVWELLAESTQDSDAQLAFYCKALSCKTKEVMKVELLQNAAVSFVRIGRNNDARYLINEASRIRQAHHWALTSEMLDMMRQPWYAAATPRLDKQWVAQQAALAENYIPIQKKGLQITDYSEIKPFRGALRDGCFVDDVYIPSSMIACYHNGDLVRGIAAKRIVPKDICLSRHVKWCFVAIRIDGDIDEDIYCR